MYNKLCTRILDSSIWLEPDATRIVWITLLAAMDQDGHAHFSAPQNLADRARVSLEATLKAIETLSTNDPNSGNPANDGRRLERVPGGYMILNAVDVRKEVSALIARANTAARVRGFRARKRQATCNAPVTPSEAEAEASKNKDIGRQADHDSAFEEFWLLYPKHVKKRESKKVWQAKKLDTLLQTFKQDICLRLAEDRRWKEGFIPDATTYLRGERWQDEIDRSVPRETNRKLSAVELVRDATRKRQAEREAEQSTTGRGTVEEDGRNLRPSLDSESRSIR